jgi:hypothetical protein
MHLCREVPQAYDVVFFLNSDILINYSDINRFFDYVDLFDLDICQPALSVNSYFSHNFLLKRAGLEVAIVPFVEIMMPCLSRRVINEMVQLNIFSISGWGMDCHLFPTLVRRMGLRPQCVVHAVSAIHAKPVESGRLTFSNGLTASEERSKLAILCSRLQN